MDETAVLVRGLVKRYGATTALNGVDFTVRRGEVFGLLGANGAGKTTAFECMEGLRAPTAGTIRVAGCDPQRESRALRRKLGVQLQLSALPDTIRVREAVELLCAWQRVPAPEERMRAFAVEELLNKQYRSLSIGQKRRVQLLLALCNRPEVLVLDEPTAGLDVQSRARLHDEIRAVREQGVTVLLATHDMAEAETLCDRIAILSRGRIAVCGTPAEITAAGESGTRIRLRTARGSLRPGSDVGGAAFVEEKDGYLEWNGGDSAAALIELLTRVREAGDTVEDLRVERPTLEERFLELTDAAARPEDARAAG